MRKKARPTTKADETPEFVAFWNIWRPHMNPNDGRGAARDEFLRHVEQYGVDPQDIVDGASWFIRSGGNQKRSFDGNLIQSHAMTWLNKRAYEDGAEMERDYRKRMAERQQSANVVSIKPAPRPANHFMNRWERGEFKAAGE